MSRQTMSRFGVLGICCAGLLIAKCALTPSATVGIATQKLTVREDAERVVLAWSGPIVKPMREEIAAALDRYESDPRRLVLALNSPGGSVSQGHAVMSAISDAARSRRIDTRIENGAVCASMCVPIYLMGAERTADAGGQFMFHEVSFDASSTPQGGRKLSETSLRSRKALEALFTDVFYGSDLDGKRVDTRWLRDMRKKIAGHEIWVSARQLVDEHAGIVDVLVPTVAR